MDVRVSYDPTEIRRAEHNVVLIHAESVLDRVAECDNVAAGETAHTFRGTRGTTCVDSCATQKG